MFNWVYLTWLFPNIWFTPLPDPLPSRSSNAPPQYMQMGSMAPAQPQGGMAFAPPPPAPEPHKNEDDEDDDEDYDS